MSTRTPGGRIDRHPPPPRGSEDHVSRREAARILGFASDFKVRQLEKEGRLTPLRGGMGQAWYPRAQVVALVGASQVLNAAVGSTPSASRASHVRAPVRRWSDAALIVRLRAGPRATADAATRGDASLPSPTVVDLVAETGVSIARAERVFRFWLTHDSHPVAAELRIARAGASGTLAKKPQEPTPSAGAAPRGERRAPVRLRRHQLIEELRDADPSVREEAFRKLRALRDLST